VKPVWGLILLALVVALIAIEIFSNRTMKRLGIEPTPAAKWLRVVNLVAVILVVAFALWVVMKG